MSGDEAGPAAWQRPRRRARTAGIAAAALVTLGIAGAAAVGFGGAEPSGTPAGVTGPAATARVTRQTLENTVAVQGELSYGETTPIAVTGPGTVTWLPAVGARITRGKPLLRVDERPVVLLYGALPMYRPLRAGVEGSDVRQFERNLRALGYQGFTADSVYSSATVDAVKRWQADLGLPETGVVGPEHAVYASGELRIEERRVRVGAPASGEVLGCTGTRKVVTADVDAADAGWAKKGAAVTVTLPGGTSVAGKVADVGREAVASDDQQQAGPPGQNPGSQGATVRVTVGIADQRAVRAFERSPVDVGYVSDRREEVLAVPVAALLALAEGGYGVEVVQGAGTRVIAVQVGLIADGLAEVSGAGLAEGMTVEVPE